MTQSTALDQAAQAHADYLLLNNLINHQEDPSHAGFFGATFAARMAAAGYAGSGGAGEVVWPSYGLATGAEAIRGLLGAPYHARILLDSFRDVGIGHATGAAGTRVVLDLGSLPWASGGSSAVVTYPCEASTGVAAFNANEVPSPLPASAGAGWGQPILLRGAYDLQLRSATITGPLGSVPIQVIYGRGQAADPNGMIPEGWAAVIPAVLAADTSYDVAIDYVSAGVAATRRFRFRTGPA